MSTIKFEEGRLMQVLVAPIVSEKATLIAEKSNSVTFKVLQDATKPEIGAAIATIFNVTVTDVATINVRGKMRRRGIRTGYTSRWKKAIVTLAAGNTIDVFEGM